MFWPLLLKVFESGVSRIEQVALHPRNGFVVVGVDSSSVGGGPVGAMRVQCWREMNSRVHLSLVRRAVVRVREKEGGTERGREVRTRVEGGASPPAEVVLQLRRMWLWLWLWLWLGRL